MLTNIVQAHFNGAKSVGNPETIWLNSRDLKTFFYYTSNSTIMHRKQEEMFRFRRTKHNRGPKTHTTPIGLYIFFPRKGTLTDAGDGDGGGQQIIKKH